MSSVLWHWDDRHEIMELIRKNITKLLSRRPVFELQDDMLPILVSCPRLEVLKSFPIFLEGLVSKDFSILCVYQVKLCLRKLAFEDVGGPKVSFKPVVNFTDNDRLVLKEKDIIIIMTMSRDNN